MPDLMTRLAALHDATPGAVGDDVVAADVHRGHTALTVRRRRRMAVAGVAAVAVVGTASVSYATFTGDVAPAPRAVGSQPVVTDAPTTAVRQPPVTTIRLVSYQGAQLPGYTVTTVPQGYVLQGISGSVLAVAKAGDTSSLDTFAGKLVVMLDDFPDPGDGRAVTVGGHAGHLTDADGVQLLRYSDGRHDITVQAWSDVDISADQLIAFAAGVTVLPGAQVGNG